MKKHSTRSISLPCGVHKVLLGVALLFSVPTSNAIASPSVNGTRISWPDDGWYQVQTADGSQTLCNGGGHCDVSPGRYLVINHTTGERFNNVEVPAVGDSVNNSGVTVNGSQISWPDDGWYQVQSSDGSQTFCNGGSVCDVDPGVYLVINHSTGERFNNIEVGATSNMGIAVNDSRISWPDDGWYQVQTADGSQTLCNGGRFCEVGPGQYLVINHTAGERFNNIEVGGDASNLSTIVNFDITVPVYMPSNELQVRLTWGDINATASWIRDEQWSLTADFDSNTENLLTVTFTDRNEGVTLGSVETNFKTTAGESQDVQITADQFDTERWDNDSDSVSNFDELIAGSDPFVDEDLILPIEDSVLGSAYVSRYFESRITDERPLYLTFQPVPNDPDQDWLSGNVDLDVDGNGTLTRNARRVSNYDTKQGTRTHSQNTVSWEGVVTGSQSDYWYTVNFSNTMTLIDDSTRSYVEVRTGTSIGLYTFNSEIRSNLIGRLIEGTSVCEPIAGTYYSLYTNNSNRSTYSETSVSREIGEPYWRVTKVSNTYKNPELVTTEYFARELSMSAGDLIEENGFICDVVEFKN